MRFGRFRNFNIEGSLKVQRLLFFEWFYCKDGIVFLNQGGTSSTIPRDNILLMVGSTSRGLTYCSTSDGV